MRNIMLLSFLSAILILQASCPAVYAASEPGHNSMEGRLSRTESAFRLLSELVSEQPGRNVIISPLSIDLALSMTYNGARGDTEKAMAQAMGISGTTSAALNSKNQDLLKRLADKDRDIELAVASSIWTKPGVRFNKDFISQVARYYSADVKAALDTAEINGWVVKKTKGRIKKIVETISADSVMVILNAVYFNGTWTTPFSKNRTGNQLFQLNDNDRVNVPMMRRENVNGYAKFDDFQSVYLTYGNARAYRMYIFCPDSVTGLPAFLAGLNDKSWNTFISRFPKPVFIKNREQMAKCLLVLPKFAAEYENDMREVLSKMGMENAFNAEKADFSGMSAEKLHIEKVQHKCCVEFSEEGTETRAATAVTMTKDQRPAVIVNRPFFFAITHDTTGTILFMGAVYNPQNKVKR